MRKIWTFLWLFIAFFSTLSAQTDRNEQAWRNRIQTRTASEVETFVPFTLVQGPDLSQFVKKVSFLKIDRNELQRLITEQPNDLRIVLPMINGGRIEVDLFPSGILADDFNVWTPDGATNKGVKKYPISDKGLHYWGAIAGQPNTTAAFSFYQDQIFGVVMTPTGNYNIGILNDEKPGDIGALYAFFNDNDHVSKNPFSCHENESPLKRTRLDHLVPMASTTCKVVRIYFEADKHLHDAKGGVVNTQAYVTGFFNVVGVVYANENITLELGDIKVWNTPDPYVSFTTTNQFLTEFRNNQIPSNPFTWNLAHLVSSRLNIGGLAYLDVLCSGNRGLRSGFSAIFTSFQPLPTYSWTINVISHEVGHNFSSPHTHNCGWPGGAIDGCAAVEGACTRPPNANPGTIMSYCHTVTSVDLNLGFGPYPGNRIRQAYQNATCLGTTTVTASITSPASPFNLCQGNNVTLTAQSCTGCTYQWKRNGTNIGGATNTTYTTNVEGTYTVEVRRFACRALSEPVSVILVTPPCNPNNGTVTGGVSLACGNTPSGTLTLSGHTGTVTRWESSTDNFVTVTNINSTTTTITYPGINQTTCYRAVINNGGTTYSAPHCIVIATPPAVNAGLDAVTLCQDSVGTLWANSPNAISYSWQPATGLSNANISHPQIIFAVSTTYTVVVTDNNGCTNSAGVTVTLNATGGTATAANTNLCMGDQAILTLGTPINGTITWQQRTNCTGSWVTATGTGVNTPNFTSNAYLVSGSMCYRAQVVQGGCTYISNVVTVTICGDVRFTCTNLTYNQNFDSWNPSTPTASTCFAGNGISWLDDYSLPGFYVASARGTLNINTREVPNCVAWGIVNLGVNGSTDRALGTMTRSNVPANELGMIGIKCRNNTGGTINSVALNYVVEQWMRNPNNGLPTDRLDFQYSLDATALTNGTWTDFNALDAVSPQIINGFALIGNAPANRANVSGTINALSIANGATFWLRWVDFDQRTLDWQDALGVEDLNITVTFTGGLSAPNSVTRPVEHCANEDQTYTISPVTGSGTVRYNWTIPGGCTGWSLQSPNNTSSTTMVIRSGSANCSGISVTATDDCSTSAPFNFNITFGSCLGSVGGTVTANQTICNGSSPNTLTLSGQVGNVVRWESSINCPAFTAPTTINNTNTTYSPGALAQTTCFRAVVQNGNNPTANSNPATITVMQPGSGGTLPANVTACDGDNVTLTLTGQSGTIIRWESSTDNFVTITTINNTNGSYAFLASLPSRSFRVVTQNTPCASILSSVSNVTINICGQNGGNVTANQTVCVGNSPNPLTLSGHTGTVVRWESSTDNFVTITTINNTTTTHTPGVLGQNTCFRAAVQDINLPLAFSTSACITVINVPSGGTVSSNATVCQGVNSTTLTLTGHVGNVLNWESSTDNFQTVTTINNVTTTQTFTNLVGTIWCRVRVQNPGCPVVLSSTVTIVVVGPGTGGTVSANQTVCAGDNITLNLAGQSGTIIRWESSTDNFVTVTTINNVTANHSFTASTPSRRFRAVIQNTPCPAIFSTSANVTINVCGQNGGNVTVDQTVCTGSPVNTLTLSGHTGTVVRWESSTDNFNTVTTINNTNTTYNPGVLTQNTCFRAVVQDINLPLAVSTPACITLTNAPSGGMVNAPMTVCRNVNTGTLTLTGHVGNILNWEYSTDNFVTSTTINNVTTTHTFNNLTLNTWFRARVQNPGCPAVLSASVQITVVNAPLGGNVTADQTVCPNINGAILRLANYAGTIVRWESSTDNFTTIATIANTTNLLNPGMLNQTTKFRAVVQNTCSTVVSTNATLTVLQGNGGTLSQDMTICNTPANGTLTLTGYSGTIAAWEGSTDNFITIQPFGIQTPTFTFSNLTTTTKFRVRITEGNCVFYSNPVTITVIPAPKGGFLYSNQTICEGQNASTLLLSSFVGNIIRWESSTDNFTTVTTINNTLPLYNPNPVNQTTAYRVVVNRTGCAEVLSATATITFGNGVSGGSVTSDQTVCTGQMPNLLTLSGQQGTVIRWESSTDNFVTNTVINNTNTTYQPMIVNVTTSFRAVVKGDVCGNAYSTPATITITQGAEGGILSADQTICSGNMGGILLLTNYVGNIVRWESSTDNFALNVQAINNTLATYNPGVMNVTLWYRAVVSQAGCNEVQSNAVKITVIQGPNGGTLLQDQTVCSGGTPNNLSLTLFSGIIVQWESSTDNFMTFTVIPNTNAIYNPGVLVQTTSYRVKVSSGNCPDVYSNPITITVVNNIAQGGNVTADRTLCSNDNNIYTLTLSGQVGPIIRWEASEDNFMSVSTFANTNTTHDYSRLRATTKFRAVVGVTGCALVYSTPATITVLSYQENGILTNLGNGQLGCSNNTGTLTLNNYVGTIVRWESSTDNFTTVITIPNVNNTYAYTVSQPTQFRVVVNHPVCGNVYSPAVTVTPGLTLNVNAWRECNATGKIVAVASGGTSPYIYSITPISGQQSQTGIFTGLALGTYTITVRDRFNCTATATITIPGTVTPPRITNIIPVGNTSARVIWDVVMPGGVNVLYQLQHRPVGSPTWSAPIQYNTNVVTVSGLIPNTQYEVQVKVRCLPSTLWGTWSPSTIFQTAVREGSDMLTDESPVTIELYPNPNKGNFNIRVTESINEFAQVSIFDATGRLIYSQNMTSEEMEIQLPNVTSGIYTVKVQTGDTVRFTKMVIQE